jgi:hypothetical protein
MTGAMVMRGAAAAVGAVPLPAPVRVTDFWTGVALGPFKGVMTLAEMPPHSARLLKCE